MRDKLNNSPAAQVVVVLILVAAAFFMFTKMGGGGSSSSEPSEGEVAATVNGALGTGSSPGEAVENAVDTLESETTASTSQTASAPPVIPSSIAVPPLPAPVRRAYAADKIVTLLVVHDGGIDDKLVADSTRRLAGYPDAAVFVVPAKQIARYSAITLGAEVLRLPALVVVRPRRLNHGIARASVIYGFQTEAAIAQAMRDATYNGPEATYHPG
ncbi:MAG TPA: hypothetical protein VMT37_13465 [Solirubrobacterales bacterium]|nr:hypothetical protein [Solirubrobacterales bacterium]